MTNNKQQFWTRFFFTVAAENFRVWSCAKKEEKNPEKLYRLFWNAAVSLNSIPEYIYYHFREFYDKKDFKGDQDFRKKLMDKHKVLKELADIANVAKHGYSTKIERGENELFKRNKTIVMNINISLGTREIERKMIKNETKYEGTAFDGSGEATLNEAFKFWVTVFNDGYVHFDKMNQVLFG